MKTTNKAATSMLAVLLATIASTSTASAQVEPTAPAEEAIPSPTPATPPAATSTDTPQQAPTNAQKKWNTPVGLRLDGGYSPRRVFDLPISGADLGLGLGAQTSEHLAIWGATRVFFGSTENGLNVWHFRLGADMEGVIADRFRIGGGLNVFFVGIKRAVHQGTIIGWGPGAHLTARFDVFRADSFALFARASIDVGAPFNGKTIYWGPFIGAGVDFDLTGKREYK